MVLPRGQSEQLGLGGISFSDMHDRGKVGWGWWMESSPLVWILVERLVLQTQILELSICR